MTVRVTGLSDLRKMIGALHLRQTKIKPFLDLEAERLLALVAKSWAERRGPDGKSWAPYQDPSRDGGGVRQNQSVRAGSKKLTFQNRTAVGVFHWYGTEFMPARNPTPFERLKSGGYEVDPAWMGGHLGRLHAWLLGEDLIQGGPVDGR